MALPDPILPPSLAYELGIAGAQRAKARRQRAEAWTPEGLILRNVRADGQWWCDCHGAPILGLTETHPKGSPIESTQVRELFAREGSNGR